eukprot:jgi/Psemu1/35550/gm1.35550_g
MGSDTIAWSDLQKEETLICNLQFARDSTTAHNFKFGTKLCIFFRSAKLG